MYDVQSGIGVAAPTHESCCTALGNPVLSMAEAMRLALGVFWKTPMPPRTTARGPRIIPSNIVICGAVPYVYENPTRGLTYKRFGTLSLPTPNTRCTSE